MRKSRLNDRIENFIEKAKSSKPPYIKKLDSRGKIDIWLVSGKYIRTNIDEEFTNFGQHYAGFKYIPKDELWLDAEYKPNERNFFIENLLVQHNLGEKDVPYEKQYVEGTRAERKERKLAGDVQKTIGKKGKRKIPTGEDVHDFLWKKLENGIKVWVVKGRLVRSIFDINFTQGGHEYVYEYIPPKEVWIDNDIVPSERGYVLLHELHEMNLMKKGVNYNNAHEDSSKIEYKARQNPDLLHELLQNEGWG